MEESNKAAGRKLQYQAANRGGEVDKRAAALRSRVTE